MNASPLIASAKRPPAGPKDGRARAYSSEMRLRAAHARRGGMCFLPRKSGRARAGARGGVGRSGRRPADRPRGAPCFGPAPRPRNPHRDGVAIPADFSRVRLHAGAQAAESAQAIGAKAYSVGSDIVFAQGQYSPRTQAGSRLLAHELTHVLQQGEVSAIPASLALGSAHDASEREADAVANAVVQGKESPVAEPVDASPPATIQRDLATPLPSVAPAAQADLTPDQIQRAIAFNSQLYDRTNTLLIQALLGGPQTGVWTEDNIIAVAATQEQYGLAKDGMVGFETFRFLNSEERLEGLSTSTANCLTSLLVIGPDTRRHLGGIPQTQLLAGSSDTFEHSRSSRAVADAPNFNTANSSEDTSSAIGAE